VARPHPLAGGPTDPTTSPWGWADAADVTGGQAAQLARLAAEGARVAASLHAEDQTAMATLVDTAVSALRGAEAAARTAAVALRAAADGRRQ